MPFYDYKCEDGHVYEEMHSPSTYDECGPCPQCGKTGARVVLVAAHLDYRMGVDPDGFPTMADKWAKIQKSKNSGKMGDSNNLQYGNTYLKED